MKVDRRKIVKVEILRGKDKICGSLIDLFLTASHRSVNKMADFEMQCNGY